DGRSRQRRDVSPERKPAPRPEGPAADFVMKTTQTESKSRLEALRELLSQGKLSTQDELREELQNRRFEVTQSTISRDLRRLGAVKAVDPDGRTVYRLSAEPNV